MKNSNYFEDVLTSQDVAIRLGKTVRWVQYEAKALVDKGLALRVGGTYIFHRDAIGELKAKTSIDNDAGIMLGDKVKVKVPITFSDSGVLCGEVVKLNNKSFAVACKSHMGTVYRMVNKKDYVNGGVSPSHW